MIHQLAKYKNKIIAILVTIPLLIIAGYYLLTPRAVISNLSDVNYAEFVMSLPASRISFSPVEANSTNSIYFSPQHSYGAVDYSLVNAEGDELKGSFEYSRGNELGRILRITIDSNGGVSVSE